MINRRNIILFIPIFLFVTFPLWRIPVTKFLAPRVDNEPAGEKHQSGTTHDFEMEGVTILQNQNGKKTATIRAKVAQTGENPNEFVLEWVDADVIGDKSEVTNIIAQTGLYNVDTKLLILEKNVIIRRVEDKQTMRSDYVVYNDKKRTVVSPGKTEFIGEDFNIVGGSMNYDIKTESYRLSKRVHCIIGGTKE